LLSRAIPSDDPADEHVRFRLVQIVGRYTGLEGVRVALASLQHEQSE